MPTPNESAARKLDIDLAGRPLGDGHPCYLIAEAGSNHGGDLEQARELVRQAAAAGADAIKFQSFTADGLVARTIPAAGGGSREHPSYATLRRLAVPVEWHAPLAEEARGRGIHFLSTPFEDSRVDLLESLNPPAYKVASGDLTHRPLLQRLARTGRPMLISTGLATEDEIARALEWVRGAGPSPVALLHCVGLYPPPAGDLNLRAVPALRRRFQVPCGFSDHTLGAWASLGAVALGAALIEKHFTLDRSRQGPDHPHSLEPAEFRRLAQEVRWLEEALGDGRKRPTAGEEPERLQARRGTYAARRLLRGETLQAADLLFLRPAHGLAPDEAVSAVGRRVVRDLAPLEPIQAADLEPAASPRR